MEDLTNRINMFKIQKCSQGNINAPSKGKKQHHSTSITSVNGTSCIANALKRYQSQQLQIFTTIDKKEIFAQVLIFLNSIIPHPKQLQKLIKNLHFQDDQDQSQPLQLSDILSQNDNNSNSLLQKPQETNQEKKESFNLQKIKKIRVSNAPGASKQQFQAIKKLKANSKISIMMSQCIFSEGDFSPLCSAESIKTISSMNIPTFQLNLKMVQDIFEQPQPFLINLSICLMLKFLYYSKLELTQSNACWILAVGTIVAYKIYYDQPVQGLVDSFAYILGMKRQQIIDLQICFLNAIEHRAIIDSRQYHLVLTKIVMI